MNQFHKERTLFVGERDTIGFEFYGDDLAGGATVSSGTVAVSPATGLELGSLTALITTTNDSVYAWVTGIAAGDYYVTFTVTFSDGKILKRIYRVVVPDPTLSSNNILTIEEARAFLKGDTGIEEGVIETAIEGVSARFANRIGTRSLRHQTYTAMTLDSPGEKYLYLPAWPVTAITSITEDGVTLVENTDFYVDYDAGILERISDTGNWLEMRRAIVVTFAAGYAISGTVTLPYALKYAAMVEVGRAVQAIQHRLWGEQSRSTDEGSVSFNTDEFLPETVETLRHYRRFGV